MRYLGPLRDACEAEEMRARLGLGDPTSLQPLQADGAGRLRGRVVGYSRHYNPYPPHAMGCPRASKKFEFSTFFFS